ncbi:amidinotransferase [Pilimelia terevasa]|uniref:Amidinotransferase n=1 Tax=Pilimelia terevasa TaxID=53372 RepID=A0A8J3FIM0_9ACTN|nr:dimethylargininase [Pilimelia terevasa]GGK33094.1 amidinotransferase [Pilimelia terevasa]
MERLARQRSYLLCPPTHFTVEYVINPWMDPDIAVDTAHAVAQWTDLRDTLAGLGHEVCELAPEPGLPDMVFAANGAFVVDGVAYGAQFKYPQRAAEAKAHQRFYEDAGWRFVPPTVVNEGEGDFAYLPAAHGGLILAGFGFRTETDAHGEAQEALGRPVISLKLVDPHFYHLDTALAALDDGNVVYYPAAFSDSSQRVLRQLFPDAVVAPREDAMAFGLNLVSDGRNVVLNTECAGLARTLAAAGYHPVPVDLSELKKGGGSVKCCVAELRR